MIRLASAQWYQAGVLSGSFLFGNRKKSQVAKSGEYGGLGMTTM
jgi:hypothetical protein